MGNKIMCVICDIDNVYSDSREWIKYVPEEKDSKNREAWDAYNEKHYLVKPNKRLIPKIVECSQYIPILFITSREDRNDMRKKTIEEIEKFSGNMIKIGPMHRLYMRPDSNYDPSADVKEKILVEEVLNKNFQPIIALDDDESNINMYKKYNIDTKLYDISKAYK